MASFVPFKPTSLISKALFNFDEMGLKNFRLSGQVRVSVSDYIDIENGITQEINWNTAPIDETLKIFSQFANINFTTVVDYDFIQGGSQIASQIDVGNYGVSDINITLFFDSSNPNFLGISSGQWDDFLGYKDASGDVQINYYGSIFNFDLSFADATPSRQTLMHELGHSLGLSHPHTSFDLVSGVPTLSKDFSALVGAGFQKLGFNIDGPLDLYKEYFSIMSYDDESPLLYHNAFTPMILDVIALQNAYGEGSGTTGSGDDIITAGTIGYRTYFDTGGNDIVDGSMYDSGVYINLGVPIKGAKHLVGIVMSLQDASTTILDKGNPSSLRWLYGKIENSSGSNADDLLIGNKFSNLLVGWSGGDLLAGLEGNDFIFGENGNDTINGGTGSDKMFGGAGDDTYHVDSKRDFVSEVEAVGKTDKTDCGGIDSVICSVDFTLGKFLENLSLADAGNLRGTGNSLANKIGGNDGANTLKGMAGGDLVDGGAGSDTLHGGTGKDVLTGGTGQDFFVFDTVAKSSNVDQITDFASGEGDKIQLSKAVFRGITHFGSLTSDEFYAAAGATKARDASDRVIYDTASGKLFYDADGFGGAAAVQIAVLGSATHPVLIYSDIQIIA